MSEYLKALEMYEQIPSPAASQPPDKKFQPRPDPILLKLHPDPHPLSSEEQVFFVKLTEGAFGFNEHVRNETLQVLGRDYHVKFLAPYLSQFIKDSICVNIAFPDLSLLIYSVRMIKSLMANPHVNIKEHLHLLLPATISCVVSRKISKYSYDNHWTLRDFSAQVVATLCSTHSNKINQIKTRVIKIYLRAIQDLRKPLSTLYGSLKGLSCFGEETIKTCVVPLIPVLSHRVCMVLEKTVYLRDPSHETKQIKRITDLVLSVVGPVLLQYKNVNDGGVSYVKEFGYLGYTLYNHVKHLEKVEAERKNHFNVYLLCR
ncbi:transcription initiation factor TFIID subunit 6-like [Tribolium madens]|uniref:transcription initiation factor TFIID subunit 6-like n=1 Tax=Tribolium madens TaxID=41895 RepID=UPI001CF72B6F|nr:transcription initiation factor TFIID subunit 6-like [Tribolium madens]XP_044267895.1 transcription initiation factor TFIID subunit 6-like [Tribolium madens]